MVITWSFIKGHSFRITLYDQSISRIFLILFLACFCYLEPLFDANRKRIGPFTMIPLTLERKRMEDEWEDAMSPLFRQGLLDLDGRNSQKYLHQT